MGNGEFDHLQERNETPEPVATQFGRIILVYE